MMRLKSLRIRGFRGVRDWEIPLEGKSLVLWGENASGKSSVVDAVDFLFTGQVRHLVGTRGLSVTQHAPHVELGRTVMDVSASFDPGAVHVSRSFTCEFCVPPVLEQLWQDASAGACILRRSQLLEFIQSDPADRFRAIASMIGAERLDGVELSMMRARDHFEGQRRAQEEEVRRIIPRLASVAGGEASTPDAALQLLNRDVAGLSLQTLSSLDVAASTAEEWLRSAKLSDQAVVASLQQVRSAAEAAKVPPELDADIRKYGDAHRTLLSERAKLERLPELELLEVGERLLAAAPLTECPLCEQPIDSQSTLSRVRERRQLLHDLSEEVSELRKKQAAVLGSLSSVAQRVGELQRLVPVIPDPGRSPLEGVLERFARQCGAAVTTIESSTAFEGECAVDGFLGAIGPLGKACEQVVRYADQQQQALALTERDQSILSLAQRARELAGLRRDFEGETRKLTQTEELEGRARYVFDTFSRLKKAEVRRIYDAIEGDIQRFYDVLHPGEIHGDFRLVLAEGRRASTELRLRNFGRTDDDPRAFSSEGHLDSLGLCIFLAFVKQFAGACPLVVLDDVVMSIDSSHRGRVAELLLTEFSNRQLIITTHDSIWLDELAAHQRAYGADGRFINQRIHRWSLQEGPVVFPYKPRWERIEARLAEADKTGAANDGRQFLEWVLLKICTGTLARPVLREDGRYTVADLLQPARVRLVEILPSLREEIDCLFREIMAAGTPRNLLSHYNADAESASMAEIERCCRAGKALAGWYECASCGTMPRYFQELGIIRCPNSRCKLPKELKTA